MGVSTYGSGLHCITRASPPRNVARGDPTTHTHPSARTGSCITAPIPQLVSSIISFLGILGINSGYSRIHSEPTLDQSRRSITFLGHPNSLQRRKAPEEYTVVSPSRTGESSNGVGSSLKQ